MKMACSVYDVKTKKEIHSTCIRTSTITDASMKAILILLPFDREKTQGMFHIPSFTKIQGYKHSALSTTLTHWASSSYDFQKDLQTWKVLAIRQPPV